MKNQNCLFALHYLERGRGAFMTYPDGSLALQIERVPEWILDTLEKVAAMFIPRTGRPVGSLRLVRIRRPGLTHPQFRIVPDAGFRIAAQGTLALASDGYVAHLSCTPAASDITSTFIAPRR